MFAKFDYKTEVVGQNPIKSSVQRSIRKKILEQHPRLEPHLETIFPKKKDLVVVKCTDHIELIMVEHEILFFKGRDDPYFPTLTLLHRFPDILPKMQVDKGAIKFLLRGADIMCPGLTHPTGSSMEDVPEKTVVAIMAEGKTHAMAIGFTRLSTEDIRKINKDVGIDTIHYLKDGLWRMAFNQLSGPPPT